MRIHVKRSGTNWETQWLRYKWARNVDFFENCIDGIRACARFGLPRGQILNLDAALVSAYTSPTRALLKQLGTYNYLI